MKQLNKSDNQFGSLDPEKVYFVEKFGYLVKKINGGYGGPVQNALFDRINGAVNQFKTDLPNIVHNLEIKRLKSISNRSVKQIDAKDFVPISNKSASSKTEEITKKISDRISEIEKTIAAKTQTDTQGRLDNSKEKQIVIEKEIDIIIENPILSKQSGSVGKSNSSILKPSIAAIREEQRLETIKAQQKKIESSKNRPVTKQFVAKSKSIPVKKITEWERRWHKYDGDAIGKDFNGYN